MKHRILPLLCLGTAIAVSTSCNSGSGGKGTGDSSNAPVTVLSTQIESLHEQTMNKVAPLRRTEDSIRIRIAQLATTGGDTSKLSAAAAKLHTSDTAMFGWMGRYDMQLEDKTEAQKEAYLTGQVQELSAIERSIDSAVRQGQELLGSGHP